jgi:hypothetical protein
MVLLPALKERKRRANGGDGSHGFAVRQFFLTGALMKKLILIFILAAAPLWQARAETVDVSHFLITPSYNGASGFIKAPAAYIAPQNIFALGLHNFVFKANYGLFDMFEIGINVDFAATSEIMNILKGTDLNFKGRILKEEEHFVSLSAGIDKFPMNIFESMNGQDFGGYIVVSKKIDDMAFSLGVKKFFTGYPQDNIVIADVSKVINETVLAILEYNMGSFNAGIKISLNSNINVELFLSEMERVGQSNSLGTFLRENFIFGITYIQ